MTTQGIICPGSGQSPETNSRVGTDAAYCASCGALRAVRGKKLARHYSTTPSEARYLAERAARPPCEALVEHWGQGAHNEPCQKLATSTVEVHGTDRRLCGTHAGVAKRGGVLTLAEVPA